MPVSKRVRFEVLRRDNFTCQYCGAKAPDVKMQIDHVIPAVLGGSDKPENLVAACEHCNTGKTSIHPDAPLVQSLSAEAAAYALGMVDKMTRFRADIEALDDYEYLFLEEWEKWKLCSPDTPDLQGKPRLRVPLDPAYRMTLYRWMRMGVPSDVFGLAIPAAMNNRSVSSDKTFAYMCGIIWNLINQCEIDYSVTESTCVVYTAQEAEQYAVQEYHDGYNAGLRKAGVTP